MPESVLFDAPRNRLIVSVMQGHPGAADGKGGLALLSAQGVVLDADWVSGMDAPKGLALMGDRLLVADLTRLHVIDVDTGAVLDSLTSRDMVFLNDVTATADEAFVSDLMTGTIWRYAGGTLLPWLNDPDLPHPNGLLIDGDDLLVATWGKGLREDFSTETPGDLIAISRADQSQRVLAAGLGNLDGVARLGASLYVNDWVTGALFAVTEGQAAQVATGPAGLADIAPGPDGLLMPLMLDGAVEGWSVP